MADSANQDAMQQAAQESSQQQSSQDTTTSGDAKGEQQSISKSDVGNVSDVLGQGATGSQQQASGDQVAAGATKSDATQAPAAGVDQAASEDVAKQAAVNTTVRKTVVVSSAPAAASEGTRDTAAPAAPAAPVQAAGVVVQKTTKTEVVDDRQLPEVVAAMKVGKPETQSALYQVIKYAQDMHPGQRIEMSQIERNQANLRVNLYTLLSAEDVNFKTVYRALLAVVRVHKNNCFAVTARNRGLNTVSMQTIDNKNMRFLTKIVDLLVLTAGTNNVEQVKQHYDFSKLAEWCPNQRIQQNLTSYYA